MAALPHYVVDQDATSLTRPSPTLPSFRVKDSTLHITITKQFLVFHASGKFTSIKHRMLLVNWESGEKRARHLNISLRAMRISHERNQ